MTLIERLAREAAPCQGADYGETCEAERCLPCHVCAVRPAIEAKMRELVEVAAAEIDNAASIALARLPTKPFSPVDFAGLTAVEDLNTVARTIRALTTNEETTP